MEPWGADWTGRVGSFIACWSAGWSEETLAIGARLSFFLSLSFGLRNRMFANYLSRSCRPPFKEQLGCGRPPIAHLCHPSPTAPPRFRFHLGGEQFLRVETLVLLVYHQSKDSVLRILAVQSAERVVERAAEVEHSETLAKSISCVFGVGWCRALQPALHGGVPGGCRPAVDPPIG
ncbi:hypothetical protein BDP81DRAFT_43034 [Colletotrichum phormii]|uniref:Uncharacterized protein n=1 Tax=Colletotrichum phormii TaxID=359342 RepID=A0AAI9ZPM4_9PEZI|nr:uncharacterized protein BDP81DRAFT_43034 [Colletotrichum phormii]KAK1635866.1 hypothetical protein BDP81DRAFT_43034 [Colletotrichum phormii]